jgi:hypothetical protein
MAEFPGIKYNAELPKSMDYAFLKREGIRYVQELSGKIWTDYNEHDPGVTILEQLCYSLTEIGYKTNLNIEKLMFSGDDQKEVARTNGIYPPEEIFLSGTVTANDFRIFFIDRLRSEKIDNIWFRKAKDSRQKGLYDIYVRTSADPLLYEQIQRKVLALYTAHRSLGEDCARVTILQTESIEIVTSLDISDDVLPEKIVAEVFFQLHEYFSPRIPNTSLHELLNEGLCYDEIFDLPSFEHGFIKNLKSDEESRIFSISGINAVISSIEGVRSIRNLIVKKNGIKVTGKYITIDDEHAPEVLLNPEKTEITVFKNYNRLTYDGHQVKRYYQEKIEQGNKSYSFVSPEQERREKVYGEPVSTYTSVQNTFPIVYGIGTYGLPGNAGKDRIRYARQLQSYLLLFDQVLINHLAQVENLRHLFSYKTNAETGSTYFTKLPGDQEKTIEIADFNKLVHPQLTSQKLQELVHDDTTVRKNRLLDHLLARFSEEFVDHRYSNLATLFGLPSDSDLQTTLLKLKASLLEQYAVLSTSRNKGYNYVSGLHEKAYPFKIKLCLLLNVSCESRGMFSLVEHYKTLKSQEIVTKEATSDDALKGNSTKVRFKLLNHTEAKDHLLFYGSLSDSYSINKPARKGYPYRLLFRTPKDKDSVVLAEYTSLPEAESAVTSLVTKFKNLNKRAEGFHVLEHILLRSLLDKQYAIELIIPDVKEKILFQSVQSDYLEDQKRLLLDAIISGTGKENYRITETGKQYKVKLVDQEKNDLLILTKIFIDFREADAYIYHVLVPHFKELDRKSHTIPPSATFRQVTGSVVQDNFQGSKISLIFPKWIPRFKDPDFMALLKRSLAKCLPAHISINLVWLNLTKMAEFERRYKEWLDLKSHIAKKQCSPVSDSVAQPNKRKEKRVLLGEIMQLDKLSDDIMNKFCNAGDA